MKNTVLRLALITIIAQWALFASAYDFEAGGIYYNRLSDTEVEVTHNGRASYTGNIVISATVTDGDKQYSVTKIGVEAFRECQGLTNIEIPNSVTKIGKLAFANCSDLTNIEIPNSVTEIGSYAFDYCTALTNIEISDSVTQIDETVFQRCENLESITGKFATDDNRCLIKDGVLIAFARKGLIFYSIPNSVTKIGKYAFSNCRGLTNLEIPNTVINISSNAFSGCRRLTNIEIPNSVTVLGERAFADCAALTNVHIPNSVTDIGEGAFGGCENLESITGKFATADNKCLIKDGVLLSFAPKGLTHYSIPNTVTRIGLHSFLHCHDLTNIDIPNTVTSIGWEAFRFCKSLSKVVLPSSITTIGTGIFNDCGQLLSEIYCLAIEPPTIENGTSLGANTDACTLYVPAESVEAYKAADGWKEFTQIKSLEEAAADDVLNYELHDDGTATVIRSAGEPYSGDIKIPSSIYRDSKIYCVTAIGYQAFYDCRELTNIEIPNSVTEIGEGVFAYCTDLTSIDIPNSVTSIAKAAFAYCTGLTNVKIPNSVTEIGNSSFTGCSGLTNLEIPNSVTEIGFMAFHSCSGLTNIEIPNSVTVIRESAFAYCTGLITVKIPDSVTEIGESVFTACENLESITGKFATDDQRCLIKDGVLIAFAPKGLTHYSIPNSVIKIGNAAFIYCSGLTNIEIPNSVTEIGYSIFYDCSNLTNIEIPNSVTKIGNWAFYNCSNLTNVKIPESVTEIGEYVFESCENIESFEGKFASEDNRCLIKDGELIAFAPKGLTHYLIPSTVTTIGNRAFADCTGLTNVKIPDSVTQIGNNAFFGCSALTNIEIPNSVATMGTKIFGNCDNLSEIYCLANVPPTLEAKTFGKINEACTLYVPAEAVEAYKAADGWKEIAQIKSLEEAAVDDVLYYQLFNNGTATVIQSAGEPYSGDINIPSSIYRNGRTYSVTVIGDHAFSGCTGLTNIEIPNSVTKIGNQAFLDCTGLTTVKIPDSVTEIGESVFGGCENLESITGKFATDDQRCLIKDGVLLAFAPKGVISYSIPNSVTKIGEWAFYNCRDLTNIEIPNSVTEIKIYAFYNCSSLTNIEISNSVTVIRDWAFYNCSSLTNIDIPNSVTTIGTWAFSECTGLTNVIIPDSVTEIGNGIFAGCENLESFEGKFASDDNRCLIKKGVLFAFAPKGLSSYSIPSTVTKIGRYAFTQCKELINIDIPNPVTTIFLEAFKYCSNLTTVFIQSSLSEIGRNIFAGCDNLSEIYCLPIAPPVLGDGYSFDGPSLGANTDACTLYVPAGSVEAYKAAEGWKEFSNIVAYDPVTLADYALVIADDQIRANNTLYYPVKLKNAKPAITFLCDVILPEGLAIETNDSGAFMIRKGDRMTTQELVSSAESGNPRVLSFSLNNKPYEETDGVLFYIPLQLTDPDTPQGTTYDITLNNILISNPDFDEYDGPAVTATIEVGRPLVPADVNGDDRVTPVDIAITSSVILGGEYKNFDFDAADMNNDGEVTPSDISGIVQKILASPTGAPQSLVETSDMAMSGEKMAIKSLSPATNGGAELAIGLSGAERFTALQFDLTLPASLNVSGISLGQQRDHSVAYRRIDDTTWRVVAFSLSNTPLAADAEVVVALQAPATAYTGQMRIEGAIAAELGASGFADCGIEGCEATIGQSGIEAPYADAFTVSVNGNTLVITTDSDAVMPIYDTLGRRVDYTLTAGRNEITLASGVYLVGGQKVMIR